MQPGMLAWTWSHNPSGFCLLHVNFMLNVFSKSAKNEATSYLGPHQQSLHMNRNTQQTCSRNMWGSRVDPLSWCTSVPRGVGRTRNTWSASCAKPGPRPPCTRPRKLSKTKYQLREIALGHAFIAGAHTLRKWCLNIKVNGGVTLDYYVATHETVSWRVWTATTQQSGQCGVVRDGLTDLSP